jgi:hypothetical protein
MGGVLSSRRTLVSACFAQIRGVIVELASVRST